MPSSKRNRSVGVQANIHAPSSNDGTSDLGIIAMIPNH